MRKREGIGFGAVYMGWGEVGERSLMADHPRSICFLFSVYMQRVVLVSRARISLPPCKQLLSTPYKTLQLFIIYLLSRINRRVLHG